MTNFFPSRPAAHPTIYAYEDTHPQYRGLLKVGYTSVDVQHRVAQAISNAAARSAPLPHCLRGVGHAWRRHLVYRPRGTPRVASNGSGESRGRVVPLYGSRGPGGGTLRAGAARSRIPTHGAFCHAPEQEAAVEKTCEYFRACRADNNRTPHFLWNCKMRFGKTFAAYQLARRMGWKRCWS